MPVKVILKGQIMQAEIIYLCETLYYLTMTKGLHLFKVLFSHKSSCLSSDKLCFWFLFDKYRCVALLWSTINVFSPPAVSCFSDLSFVVEPRDVRTSRGEQVSLDCQAEGEPPVSVQWMKDGVRLQENHRLQFLSNGTLYISNVWSSPEQSDEGFYQCLAQNKHGAILSQRSHLTISGTYGGDVFGSKAY